MKTFTVQDLRLAAARRAFRTGIILGLVPVTIGVVVLAGLHVWLTERRAGDLRRAEVEAAAASAELRHCVSQEELRRQCVMAQWQIAAELEAMGRGRE